MFSEWEKVFANPMATAAAIDRIVHHSVILEFDVPSYRRVASSKRLPKRSYCLTIDVTQTGSLPHDGCYPDHGGMDMVGEISTVTRTEVLRSHSQPLP